MSDAAGLEGVGQQNGRNTSATRPAEIVSNPLLTLQLIGGRQLRYGAMGCDLSSTHPALALFLARRFLSRARNHHALFHDPRELAHALLAGCSEIVVNTPASNALIRHHLPS